MSEIDGLIYRAMEKRMTTFKFRPDDFDTYKQYPPDADARGVMAKIANDKLKEYIDTTAPLILGLSLEQIRQLKDSYEIITGKSATQIGIENDPL